MMQTNLMEPWFDFQTKMFDFWKDSMNVNQKNTVEKKDANVFEECMKPVQEIMNKWVDVTNDLYTQNIKSFGNTYPQQEIINKMFGGANFYQNLNKFWEDLSSTITGKDSDPLQFYSKWNEDYTEMVSKQFVSFLPAQMKNFFNETQEICIASNAVNNKFFKPWLDQAKELQDLLLKSMAGDQEAYIEFTRLWQDNYSESFGKIFNIPQFSMNREQMQKQMHSINALIAFINTMNEFSATLIKTNQDTLENIVKDYQAMLLDGSNPKTFKEFYDYWLKQNESAYLKLFGTPEFSKLIGEVLEASVNFKKNYDDLLETNLEFLPYPSKTDMDSVYKTLDTLKRDVRSLKKELAALREDISKTGGRSGNTGKQSAKED